MKEQIKNILIGYILIALGIVGSIIRGIIIGYNNLFDFAILVIFIIIILIGIDYLYHSIIGDWK